MKKFEMKISKAWPTLLSWNIRKMRKSRGDYKDERDTIKGGAILMDEDGGSWKRN